MVVWLGSNGYCTCAQRKIDDLYLKINQKMVRTWTGSYSPAICNDSLIYEFMALSDNLANIWALLCKGGNTFLQLITYEPIMVHHKTDKHSNNKNVGTLEQ